MCPRSTGNGTQTIAASGAERLRPSLSPRRWPRADTRTSTILRFAPMSRQQAEKGDSSTSSWRLRGQASPVKFIVSVMPEVAQSRSSSRRAKRRTARATTLIDLPERAPDALVAVKAYDSDAIRDDLKQRGIRVVTP